MEPKLAGLPRHVADPDPSIYWSDNYVVLDFETTSIEKGNPVIADNRIVLASWRTPDGQIHSKFASEFEQGELVDAIRAADFIVAHSAKFELGWLRRCGIDLRKIVCYDTMLGEYVIGGNQYSVRDLGLDASLKRRGLGSKIGSPNWMIRQGFPVENIPRRWLQRYCEGDVTQTHALFKQQLDDLRRLKLEAVMYQRCLLTPALADIEFNGMQLDCEAVLAMEKELEDETTRLTNELTTLCGGIQPSQGKQLGAFLFDVLRFPVPKDYRGQPIKTPSGGYSVAAEVMEKLVATTAPQRTFLDLYRQWSDASGRLTKYIRKFGDCAREAGGRLYGVFNQCHTRTHRLSSGGSTYRVQFQNFARDLKPLFRARYPEWTVGEADGAQLEFRTAVHLGRDRVGLHYITDANSDIHKFTASCLLGISEDSVTVDQRQAAKSDTFKPLYGGSSGTADQQRYYAAFKEKYKGIADTQNGWVHTVLRDKALRTEWGLVYYWPDTHMQQSGYVTNTTSIYNYPVQAFATAEIIPCVIICAWHRMAGLRSFLVNTVHDSIIAELHPSERALWDELARQCFITDCYELIERLYGIRLTVPLGAGVMVGDRWGSKESKKSEVVYEAPRELWEDAAKREGML